jgi:biopolymer transport protein TolR
MGASIGSGSGGKKDLNVELNIVPFIDLMSCLTAFLLVTAVWVNIAKLDTHAVGKSREALGDDPPPQLSVLVQSDGVMFGLSRVNEFERIPNTPTGYDWIKVGEAMKRYKSHALLADQTTIEIAGESTTAGPVRYQALVAAMDLAVRAGFVDVGLTDAQGLSARPLL